MKIIVYLSLLMVSAAVSAEQSSWTLSADSWARPRDGQSVAQMTPLPDVVKHWSENTSQRLVIHYPGGEDGQLWAHELSSWLVSLGVPLDRQELVAGSEQAHQIEIELAR